MCISGLVHRRVMLAICGTLLKVNATSHEKYQVGLLHSVGTKIAKQCILDRQMDNGILSFGFLIIVLTNFENKTRTLINLHC